MQSTSRPEHFPGHPLIIFAAAFMLGILVESLCLDLRMLIRSLAIVSLASGACLLLRRTFAASMLLCVGFLLSGAALATIDRQKRAPNSLADLIDHGTIRHGEPVELIGVLAQQPEAAPGGFYLSLRVEKINLNANERPVMGTVSLLLAVVGETAETDYNKLNLRYGTRIRVVTTLKRADTFRNPGGIPFTEFLERKGLAASAFVKSPSVIERLGDDPAWPPLLWLYDWRERLQQRINSSFSPETAGVVSASLLGNRYFLSHSAAEKFREGGTFHVLVISGLHISFIGGLVLLVVSKFTKRRLTQFLLSALVLWSYAIAVGAEASVVRAALTFTLIAFAPVVARRGASLNALGAAALILLGWRPRDLFDPSFQLTFLSVAAIVAFAWPLLQRLSEIGSWRPTRASPYPPSCAEWLRTLSETLFWREKRWRREVEQLNHRYRIFKTPAAVWLERHHLQGLLRYSFATLVVSFCVQITLLPLFVIYFHRLSISALVLNVGVSLLMAALLFTSLAALLLTTVNASFATPLLSLTNGLQWLMEHSVDPFARLGIASLRLPEYSGRLATIYVVFFVPLIVIAIALSRWNPLGRPTGRAVRSRVRTVAKGALIFQTLLVAIIVLHPLANSSANGLRIDFLDVGQGDAALITMPNGVTLLVDGGGRPTFLRRDATGNKELPFQRDTRSIGEAVVAEYLWWRGLDHVDYLLATHADADHISGLNDVAKNFDVRAAMVGRQPAKDDEYAEFSNTLEQQSIPTQLIAAGDELRFGSVITRVLWPLPSANNQAKSGNDQSIVLRLEFGTRVILLLADVEKQSEASLVVQTRQNGEPMLAADVVKVAHHGSRTSSIESFVKAVRPKFAVISVGQNSMFGHPHAEVVARWRAVGAEVLTTGECGMITITTDGRDLNVSKFVER